jgi:hypothetical protein
VVAVSSRHPRLRHVLALLISLAAATGTTVGGQTPSQPLPRAAVRLPAWRNRLLGVYDADTGLPLEGAQVLDVLGGWSALTTTTGTVSLAFMDSGGTLIRVRKLGYNPYTFITWLTAADSTPITVVISKMGTVLPQIVTSDRATAAARGPADTIRKLDLNGYYGRRQSSGAPSSAFLSGEKLERLTLLSDVKSVTGRDICTNNTYIDGVRTMIPSSGRALRNGIDMLLSPDMVAAIEQYRSSEVPAQYSSMPSGGGAMVRPSANPSNVPADEGCATLIWTK